MALEREASKLAANDWKIAMKKSRLLAPLKSPGKARRRLFILLGFIFAFALSWASYREFQVLLRETGGSPAESGGQFAAIDSEEADVRDEDRVQAKDTSRDVEKSDGGGDDEGDYYGAENVDVDGEPAGSGESSNGSKGTLEVSIGMDPPPNGVKDKLAGGVGGGRKIIRDTEREKVEQDSEGSPSNADPSSDVTFTVMEHTEFWGNVILSGKTNLLDSADECSRACAMHKPNSPNDPPCNLWVFCGDEELCRSSDIYKECWLKHTAHPDAAFPVAKGPSVGWTSGLALSVRKPVMGKSDEDRSYHVIISAQGTATHWQSRIHYYWYLRVRKECREQARKDGTTCDMGGFTRLLHDNEPDDLMEEIPTFVAKTLPKDQPNHGYIVLNRPYAFLQWVQQATIKEKYVLMGEPDHIWLKPLPNPMEGDNAAAFPFFYIEPTTDENIAITERFVGKLETLDQKLRLYPIGSSPTIMAMDDLKRVVPIWYDLSLKVHEDEVAVEAWGWVQEMYAFSLAMYNAGVHPVSLLPSLMAQPPWDWDKSRYTLLHYTYGMDYTLEGVHTPGVVGPWHWDKRDFRGPIPRNMQGPPDGANDLVRELLMRVRIDLLATRTDLISPTRSPLIQLNEATSAIPMWDVYAETSRVTPEMTIWKEAFVDE